MSLERERDLEMFRREPREGVGRHGSSGSTHQGTPGSTGHLGSWRDARKKSSQSLQRERERERANLTLPTPVFQISSLQNQERIHFCSIFFSLNFCCLRHPVRGNFYSCHRKQCVSASSLSFPKTGLHRIDAALRRAS